jgi:hypothetical protein
MALLIASRRRDVRPAGALTIDRSHPLARGLVSAILLNENGGKRALDLVTGEYGTLTSDGKFTINGDGATFDGSGDHVAFTRNITFSNTFGAAIACCVSATAFQGSFPNISSIGGGETSPTDHQIRFGDSGIDRAQVQYIVNGNKVAGASILTTNRRYTLVGSYYNGTQRVYVDGRQDGSGSYTGTASFAIPVRLAASQANGRNLNGQIYWFYMWQRGLSPTEVQWLQAEPYAFLASPRRLWAKAASGGGATSILRQMMAHHG